METLYQFFTLPIADQARIIQAVASIVGLGCIIGGLIQMGKAGRRRNKEIDVMAEGMRENTRILSQGLERQGQALGQMVERQSQALGQMVERQSQALDRQDEVLAELLRRSTPA